MSPISLIDSYFKSSWRPSFSSGKEIQIFNKACELLCLPIVSNSEAKRVKYCWGVGGVSKSTWPSPIQFPALSWPHGKADSSAVLLLIWCGHTLRCICSYKRQGLLKTPSPSPLFPNTDDLMTASGRKQACPFKTASDSHLRPSPICLNAQPLKLQPSISRPSAESEVRRYKTSVSQ